MKNHPRSILRAISLALFLSLLTLSALSLPEAGEAAAKEPVQLDGTPIWLPIIGNSAFPTPLPTPDLPEGELPNPSYGESFQGYSRELSTSLFNTFFLPARVVPTGFTGDPDNCVAGSISDERTQLLLRQLNYFRAMAGSRQVIHNSETSKLSQAAALIMWRLEGLTHYPTEEMDCYSPEGAEGALRSTLSLRFGTIPEDTQLVGQMEDDGDNNTAVGHRFWLLAPEMRTAGFGEIFASDESTAAQYGVTYAGATYVLDVDGYGDEGWAVPGAGAVAWPPPGWVPWDLVFERWSVAFARGVDTANAQVEVTVDGVQVAANVINNGGSFNTFVWELDSPLQDITTADEPNVQVHISGVNSSNPAMRDFIYTFRPFHP